MSRYEMLDKIQAIPYEYESDKQGKDIEFKTFVTNCCNTLRTEKYDYCFTDDQVKAVKKKLENKGEITVEKVSYEDDTDDYYFVLRFKPFKKANGSERREQNIFKPL